MQGLDFTRTSMMTLKSKLFFGLRLSDSYKINGKMFQCVPYLVLISIKDVL